MSTKNFMNLPSYEESLRRSVELSAENDRKWEEYKAHVAQQERVAFWESIGAFLMFIILTVSVLGFFFQLTQGLALDGRNKGVLLFIYICQGITLLMFIRNASR